MRIPHYFISFLLTAWVLAFCGCGTVTASAEPTERPAEITTVQQVPRYDRDEFGGGWSDLDHDCQDTRNEVLIRDLVDERLDGRGCRVMSGVLHDAYTGSTVEFLRGPKTSDAVQIDHVVSLKSAWDMGAWRWTAEQRETFANDPANLLAVDGRTNNSKGSRSPAEWLPPNVASHCFYAQQWTEVLHDYALTPSPADAAELSTITKECAA